jgi:stearoyl-CoA 9-desaturase NADPH oxidoreductase
MTTTTPRLSAADIARGTLARLAERLTTPLLPSDYLDVIDPLLSGAQLRGRIVAIHPETRDAVTLVIQPGRGWAGHIPGQYVRLGVDIDGVRQWRTYSLTSPTDRPDRRISVTVKAIPDGLVSNYLVRRATVGTIVHLDRAAGDFTLGRPAPAKILFLTAGSGITPVMGMLRNMPAGAGNDVVVVHSAPTASDVIFGGELRMLAGRGRIRLVEIHTDTDGMLDIATLGHIVDDVAERHTWACGPAGLLDALESHWATAGIADRLHTERFRPTVIATGDGGTVSFSRSATTVEADGDRSLLEAGEAAGVLMPSGCRMGICFGCVAPLRSGAVRDLRNGDLTTAADGDGVVIQTCISAPAGDCDIDL